MYHLELRQFPNVAWRFNLGEGELAALLAPWVRGEIVEMGERKWNPATATATVLEGPRLASHQLSMGRGWRNAERAGEDVTARVLDQLATTRPAPAAPAPAAHVPAPAAGEHAPGGPVPAAAAGALDPLALGAQIATLLGTEPIALLEAWRQAAAASPALKPSDSLAVAERELARRQDA